MGGAPPQPLRRGRKDSFFRLRFVVFVGLPLVLCLVLGLRLRLLPPDEETLPMGHH